MKQNLVWLGLFASVVVTSAETTNNFTATHAYEADVSYNSVFQRGQWELGVNSGILFSPFFNVVTHRVVNYTTTGIQGGYMLSDPRGPGWLHGNFELVGEAFGGAVVNGKGTYVAGGTFWLRYNFVTSCRIKPYGQLGIGAEATDIDSRLLGQNFNFNADAALGLRYFVTSHCSVNLEYRYQHFSDAFMTKINVGTNAHGPVFGISWFF